MAQPSRRWLKVGWARSLGWFQARIVQESDSYFDRVPYGNMPYAISHRGNLEVLYQHNLVTPYYLRNRRRIETAGRWILDAGCGSGFKTLALAQANPGAHIVGIDPSARSVEVARGRLAHQGFPDAEFHVLGIEDLRQLGQQFDSINCDEVLYLLPDPQAALEVLAAVLAPGGILRVNLHDRHQRAMVFRAQEAFSLVAERGGIAAEKRVDLVYRVMAALRENVHLKERIWLPTPEAQRSPEWVAVNYLLEGDRGFTIAETFALIEQAGLEGIAMVNAPAWELARLFADPASLDGDIEQLLRSLSIKEQLQLVELFQGGERLIDFWCGRSGETLPWLPIEQLNAVQREKAQVSLHPQIGTAQRRQELEEAIASNLPFDLNRGLRGPCDGEIVLDSAIARGLLPLWDGPLPLSELVDRWVALICTANPGADPERLAFELLRFIALTENFAYLLVHQQTP
ncbi:class I SAM-dependent methyltransferase [Gloeobacter kilaueensis]|uniref:3-demethylubiquinone-9 3-methyltransferase n=1 Tax=Gloeobacter kilaueensis (strain ATCC BAA-2537 / CCAP 1431/1 / ULC 316 / JS1) TaxID=1183438 RepID=U5QC79_GLOK1|nr:class I SAM-dependent methyltransferase [Gloeobacter kilaueensis]AGY56428.1 3-demethylubiquinone-9 3-methyltransferase [Gloeobacter kilaueensis JS1]